MGEVPVLHLVLVPSENWSCHWMTNFWVSLLNSSVREGHPENGGVHGNGFRTSGAQITWRQSEHPGEAMILMPSILLHLQNR